MQRVTSRYPREHARVWPSSSIFELLERIRCGRLRVREPGLLPALRPSSIDRHIFPGHFGRARRIYKTRWKRRINTRVNSDGRQNGLSLFWSVDLPSISQIVACRLSCTLFSQHRSANQWYVEHNWTYLREEMSAISLESFQIF